MLLEELPKEEESYKTIVTKYSLSKGLKKLGQHGK